MGTKGHEAEVWEEIAARGTDIGHGVVIRFTSKDGNKTGLLLYHRHPDGKVCGGAVPFDVPENKWHKDRGDPLWTVESLDPLTLSPSILDASCGLHGFIRNGRWEQ